jgi:hypothetical protein
MSSDKLAARNIEGPPFYAAYAAPVAQCAAICVLKSISVSDFEGPCGAVSCIRPIRYSAPGRLRSSTTSFARRSCEMRSGTNKSASIRTAGYSLGRETRKPLIEWDFFVIVRIRNEKRP